MIRLTHLLITLVMLTSYSCNTSLKKNQATEILSANISGKWELSEIADDQRIQMNSFENDLPFLIFEPAQHKFSGFDGCNYVNGTVKMKSDHLSFVEPFAVTRKMCINMNGDEFLALLKLIDKFRIDNDSVLILSRNDKDLLYFNNIEL